MWHYDKMYILLFVWSGICLILRPTMISWTRVKRGSTNFWTSHDMFTNPSIHIYRQLPLCWLNLLGGEILLKAAAPPCIPFTLLSACDHTQLWRLCESRKDTFSTAALLKVCVLYLQRHQHTLRKHTHIYTHWVCPYVCAQTGCGWN